MSTVYIERRDFITLFFNFLSFSFLYAVDNSISLASSTEP
jgi:hypothetical protein